MLFLLSLLIQITVWVATRTRIDDGDEESMIDRDEPLRTGEHIVHRSQDHMLISHSQASSAVIARPPRTLPRTLGHSTFTRRACPTTPHLDALAHLCRVPSALRAITPTAGVHLIRLCPPRYQLTCRLTVMPSTPLAVFPMLELAALSAAPIPMSIFVSGVFHCIHTAIIFLHRL